MKQKEVILFKSKVNRTSTNSKFTFRAIVRYTIILAITALVSFTLFSINNPIHDGNTAKNVLVKMSIITIVIIVGINAIRMNQLYFSGSIFNIVMISFQLDMPHS